MAYRRRDPGLDGPARVTLHDWLTAYVGGMLGAYHVFGKRLYFNGMDALADEIEWRNANRTPRNSTLYRLSEPFTT